MAVRKALVVDDEQDARNVLSRMLELFCPEVQQIFEASDGKQALAIARQESIDLAFVDIELRQENGIALKEDLAPLCRKIVFVSAHEGWADDPQLGDTPYLFKPVVPATLQQLVAKV
ncbi:MAG: response regulator [Bacteroidota bacterium]